MRCPDVVANRVEVMGLEDLQHPSVKPCRFSCGWVGSWHTHAVWLQLQLLPPTLEVQLVLNCLWLEFLHQQIH